LQRQVRPCGDGAVDWPALLPTLGEFCPDLNLSLEDHKGLMPIPIYDPEWQAGHPELTVAEVAQVVRLAYRFQQRVAAGETLDVAAYEAIPFREQREARETASIAYLRRVVAAAGLA
jgi:hypothetical protein